MSQRLQLDRPLLKDRVAESDLLLRAIAAWERFQSRWASATGSRFRAMGHALRAWRVASDQAPKAADSRRVLGLVRRGCYEDGRLAPVAKNEILAEYVRSREAMRTRRRFSEFPVADRVRMRQPGLPPNPDRVGDLMVLKAYDGASGERGVLLIKYTESIRRFPAAFDVSALASRYMIVLEPSWWGYQDVTFLLYAGSDLDVVVLAQYRPDWEFIKELNLNLVPIRLGAGDWVDPSTFAPGPSSRRSYDLVMVSGWSPFKRHDVLFRALAAIRTQFRRDLRVALIGYPQGWTRREIERLMKRYGVADCCTIFERLPHSEVAGIVADSRAFVLLSRREGANKALYESLFCDTPVIVYRHQRGVNLEQVTSEVGVLADDDELPQAVLTVLDGPNTYRPREWALAHTGWPRSTESLNEALRALARQRGLPWTRDIVGKKNGPALRYVDPAERDALAPEFERLAQFLR